MPGKTEIPCAAFARPADGAKDETPPLRILGVDGRLLGFEAPFSPPGVLPEDEPLKNPVRRIPFLVRRVLLPGEKQPGAALRFRKKEQTSAVARF